MDETCCASQTSAVVGGGAGWAPGGGGGAGGAGGGGGRAGGAGVLDSVGSPMRPSGGAGVLSGVPRAAGLGARGGDVGRRIASPTSMNPLRSVTLRAHRSARE